MTLRLGGWQRLGIVLSILWILAVIGYAIYELQAGPASPMLLIEMVASKTGEPISSLRENRFADLVPVTPHLVPGRLVAAMLVPPLFLWAFFIGGAQSFRWIAAGFKSKNN